ncbi:hypothetical protein GPECTOR_10g834 [Gonium pectorale]|uniref:Uncharacterized protein n=1 Tax=Gonium pectorale TaxID=33097 RepID=A0A150GQY9_GONPE|nr:hypothetical protein GPECTOR_10g834 [Gonium pectorale]|eukprot:KXZ52203.1 hypothetical protein GPECTOR_10g834 [Gonium pectorale]
MAACKSGHAGAVSLLLSRGARVDTTYGSELVMAVSVDVVDALLTSVPALSAHLGRALVAAAGANRLGVVCALLRHGADPLHENGVALCEAAYQNHRAVLEALLKAGGPRMYGSAAVGNALKLARRWGRDDVAETLATLQHRVDL